MESHHPCWMRLGVGRGWVETAFSAPVISRNAASDDLRREQNVRQQERKRTGVRQMDFLSLFSVRLCARVGRGCMQLKYGKNKELVNRCA